MRRSNNAILKDAADELAGELLDEIFIALKEESGFVCGLKAKRAIYQRVEARLASMEFNGSSGINGKTAE